MKSEVVEVNCKGGHVGHVFTRTDNEKAEYLSTLNSGWKRRGARRRKLTKII